MTQRNPLAEFMIANGYITAEEYDRMVEIELRRLEENPTGINLKVKLLSEATNVDFEQADKEAEIRKRLENGEITGETFPELTQVEQDIAKLVLFKKYSPANAEISRSLSAIEFALVGLTKLFYKSVDKTKLTTEEQSFLEAIHALFSLNDMPINTTTDWRYQYLDDQFRQVQQNREEYFNQKNSLTGNS